MFPLASKDGQSRNTVNSGLSLEASLSNGQVNFGLSSLVFSCEHIRYIFIGFWRLPTDNHGRQHTEPGVSLSSSTGSFVKNMEDVRLANLGSNHLAAFLYRSCLQPRHPSAPPPVDALEAPEHQDLASPFLPPPTLSR